ncbi:MAG TPA: SidA/IucD/PvdA family monooxygenase [Jatrophihabitans sp.]|nr:SidA/IucD/PvdA family monooxygenase [Jatrophihabitans sp.]
MDHPEIELLAIGAGPSNLALAVAIEELAPADFARKCLVIEQHQDIGWQRGMLLPWAQSQVSFLKDLVTMRNPRSQFTFINYLYESDRLHDFINMSSFLPFRLEISNYLQWVARSLSRVQVQYDRRCMRVDAVRSAAGEITAWLVELSDGSVLAARNLVVGIGRDPHIPEVFRSLDKAKVIHSTEYADRVSELDQAASLRIAVVGAAQSAAEMLWESYQRMPTAQCAMIMRTVGLGYYQTSQFTNELYFPSFTDTFYAAKPEARQRVLTEMRRTNYAGVTPELLNAIYRQMYQERLTGRQRLRMIPSVDITDARMEADEVVLTLTQQMTGEQDELRCDVVMLGTGFERTLPALTRTIAELVGVEQLLVSRAYRAILPPTVRAGCYLQGTNEESHGIADSLISVLAIRAGEIVDDLLACRPSTELLTSIPVPA